MTFEEAVRQAALAAEKAVNETIAEYRVGFVPHEPEITPFLLGSLKAALSGLKTSGLSWTASIATNSGPGAQEKKYGADFLIHVTIQTPTENFSKGVLVQAKRVDRGEFMDQAAHSLLVGQCNKMLAVTAASFVFNYTKYEMRCGSASRIAGSTRKDLNNLCEWTSYRFFWEFFRCPIGDTRFKSAHLSEIPVPEVLEIRAEGTFNDGRGRRSPA